MCIDSMQESIFKNLVFSSSQLMFNSVPISGNFCCLLISLANNLDPDLFDTPMAFQIDFFGKKLI